jgi:hypothetical protein
MPLVFLRLLRSLNPVFCWWDLSIRLQIIRVRGMRKFIKHSYYLDPSYTFETNVNTYRKATTSKAWENYPTKRKTN